MASNVEIANRALGELAGNKITDLEEDSPEARKVNRVFVQVRDALLRKHRWSFAVQRASLPAEVSVPVWGFARSYPYPSNCLRLIEVNGSPQFKVERSPAGGGRAIITDQAAPLQIRYVARIEDPNEFDPLFSELFAARLAQELCYDITGSNARDDKLASWAKDALSEAKRLNAIELPPEEIDDEGNWLASREQGGVANNRRFFPVAGA